MSKAKEDGGVFTVDIVETLRRKITVGANSEIDAIQMVKQKYDNCDYVLDAGDFENVEFYVNHNARPVGTNNKEKSK